MTEKLIAYLTQGADAAACGIYEASVQTTDAGTVCMVNCGKEDAILAPAALGFAGTAFDAAGTAYVLAPLTHENAAVLRKVLPFTAPRPVLGQARTVGVGDRLGIATPGHVRVFEKYDAYPILAQQSMRELSLTGRTFEHVLDCASFGVLRAGYTRGFGADGDHLKTADEVAYALGCGYTMITLDCSEHIRNDVQSMSDAQVNDAYTADAAREAKYVGKTFSVGSTRLCIDEPAFRRMSLIYNEAIDFAASIYDRFFAGNDNAPDFEISIDETATPTDPEQHFYVASELLARGVKMATVAPRFCGEFQKGIDYIGDLAQFEKEFACHAEIARHFGYKISVHSGSDKFSVFPAVGKYTEGRFHVKTAGTNWLEAMAVVAEQAPALYREIHAFALETAFAEARKYYHVTTNLGNIPALDTLTDAQLPALFENNDARQLIHITYGVILSEKNPDGTSRFRDRLYEVWRANEEAYMVRLDRHISKHLALLYQGFEK